MTPQERAEKIFTNCFTKAELEFLNQQPAFVELSRNILTLDDTLKAVETGERLIRPTRSLDDHGISDGSPVK